MKKYQYQVFDANFEIAHENVWCELPKNLL